MGLVVLILVGILPAHYALNPDATPQQVQAIVQKSEQVAPILQRLGPNPINGEQAVDELSGYLKASGKASRQTIEAVAGLSGDVHDRIANKRSFRELSTPERSAFRSDLYLLAASISKLNKQHKNPRIRQTRKRSPGMQTNWMRRRNSFRPGSRLPSLAFWVSAQ